VRSAMGYLTVVVLLTGLAQAQALKDADEKRQAILDYQLTMPRADSMTKYVVSLPDFAERMRRSMQMTTAEQIARIEKDPKAADIVKKNELTARDYIIGVPALRMALLAASGAPRPDHHRLTREPRVCESKSLRSKAKMDAVDGAGARR
jgi:hypothetical protein